MADGERREVVSAADADGDAGDDRRRAYGGPRTRGRTSRDVTAGRKGGLPSRGGARVRTTDRRGDFGDTRRAVESGHLIYFRREDGDGGGSRGQRTGTAVQDGQASADDVQPTEADEEAESTRTGQVAYERSESLARVLLDPHAKLTGPLEDD